MVFWGAEWEGTDVYVAYGFLICVDIFFSNCDSGYLCLKILWKAS